MALSAPVIIAAPVFVSTGIPSSVQSGQAVHVMVQINSTTPIRDFEGAVLYFHNLGTGQEDWVPMNLTAGNLSAGTWTYDIPAQPWKGELECRVTAKDDIGNSVQYPASSNAKIEIIGDDPPKPFPWNLVILIGFLAVVLVLTELIFKPGFYRLTGREKARALEEEDRKREQEEMEKDN